MFCTKCGNAVPEEALFCIECGKKTNNTSMPIPAPNVGVAQSKRSGKKHFLAFGLVTALLATILVLANTRQGYLYITWFRTQKAYEKEISDFIKRNPVLKTAKDNFSRPNEQRLRTRDFNMSLCDDPKNKILHLETKIETRYLSEKVGVYLTDKQVIADLPVVGLVEGNPKKLGSDLQSLLDNDVIYHLFSNFSALSEVTDKLDGYDFSYSKIKSGDFFFASDDAKEFSKFIYGQAKNLINRAQYKKTNGEWEIGDKTVKTKQITLTINARTMNNWLNKDVLPAARKNKSLRDYWKVYDIYQSANSRWYTMREYDKMLDDMQDGITSFVEEMENENAKILINIYVHKGVAVAYGIKVPTDNNEFTFTASAQGTPYRLNDMRISTYDGRNTSSISITGDHFNRTEFASVITVRNRWTNERVNINWDLKETNNNLRIRADGETIRMTFALDGTDVVVKYDDFLWRVSRLEDAIELPKNAVRIRDFAMSSIG